MGVLSEVMARMTMPESDGSCSHVSMRHRIISPSMAPQAFRNHAALVA
jgi:hypothetical protein